VEAVENVETVVETRSLFSHQRDALRYTRRVKHPALFLEMRLGKSLVVLRSLKSLPGRVLIVAPGSALGSWINELKVEGEPEPAVLLGTKANRRELLKQGRRWNLINKEGYLSLPEIATQPWVAVVLDESHFIKNPQTKVTRFFLKHFRNVRRRYILTGTPNPESDLELWPQLAFLDGQAFGCRTFWHFRSRYYKPCVVGYDWVPKLGMISHIRRVLGERSCIIRRKDVVSHVQKIYQRREITMPPKVLKAYVEIERTFALPSGEETKYATTRYHWLRRYCGGHDPTGGMVWNGKLAELIYLLSTELNNTAVVVWYNYNQELHASCAALRKAGLSCDWITGELTHPQRFEVVNRFTQGDFRTILIQHAVAQTGVNLSRADTAIYYSTPTGAVSRTQSEDRIVDIARRSPHLILDLVVPNTVDEDSVDLAQGKIHRGQWTLDRARELARRRWRTF